MLDEGVTQPVIAKKFGVNLGLLKHKIRQIRGKTSSKIDFTQIPFFRIKFSKANE